MVIRQIFANSEFDESDSRQFATLLVFTRIFKGLEFNFSKFESSLYTIHSHICAIRIFLYNMQDTDR